MSFVSGDTGSILRVTCRDNSDNSAIDLTGSTVVLKWRDETGSLVSRSMTLTDAANGIASYQFEADELFAPSMRFEVQITDSSGNVTRSLSLLHESVRAALD